MQTISQIRELLAERGLHPKRRFGQNFLHDQNQLHKLVAAADISPGDLVLEVGPGTGTLTEALLDRGATIVVSEIDHGLADLIDDRLGERVQIIRGDCLESKHAINPELVTAIGERPFSLVANLPYQIASPLICVLLLQHPCCTGLFVTIQKEVADRLLASSSTRDFGPLTIVAQTFARVERISILKPTCFWPQPTVDSAMVSIVPRRVAEIGDPVGFSRFITRLFMKRRKQLGTIFGRGRQWPAGVSEDLRPEALEVPQLIALWRLNS